MGIIYEAKQLLVGTPAAVKMIVPEFSLNTQYRERFFREARACSQLAGEPSLVQIFNFGAMSDGMLYMIMELLHGEVLSERLEHAQNKRLPLELVLSISQQVASAMSKAHARGIVHRDLKPANLFMVRDDQTMLGERVKVLDFGIAKFVDGGAHPALTVEGAIGTTLYMAPECFADRESRIEVGPPADVYALGCVMYELLCGRVPFLNEDPRCLARMHRTDTPRPVRRREPGVPPVVDALITRMLAKQPHARPTMAKVSQQLQELLPLRGQDRRLQSEPLYPLGRGPDGIGARFAWLKPRMVRWMALVFPLGCSFLFGLRHCRSGMIAVPGGSFPMGSSEQEVRISRADLVRRGHAKDFSAPGHPEEDQFVFEQPERLVRLSPFWIDKTEVTNADFVEFLNAEKKSGIIKVGPYHDKQGDQTQWAFTDSGQNSRLVNLYPDSTYAGIEFDSAHDLFRVRDHMERMPATAMTWDAADRYCRFRSKRLPTEAEWEFVASSGGKHRFPWGDAPPACRLAVIERGGKYNACARDDKPALPDVLSESEDCTALGVCDLGGSLSEWVQDYFRERYPDCGDCRNPVVETEGSTELERRSRVRRGGAWSMDFSFTRSRGRISAYHDEASAYAGFRCASSTPR